MPMLDNMVYGGVGKVPAPAKKPEDQASHAAAPSDFSESVTVKGIITVLVIFYVIIYLLTLFERWVKS